MASTSAVKRPDYVLVVKEENLPLIKSYISNLQVLGLNVHYEKGQTVDLMFINVFIAHDALAHFSQIYDIGTSDPTLTAGFYSEPVFSTPFKNPLMHTIGLAYLKGELTDAEKIMVVNRILENAKYGDKEKEFGLTKLIQIGAIETGYPLHDGPITENGTNYRSLLYRYWSSTLVTHMQQPLDTIFRYFGNEVAFYFAWLEYFNIMLAIPAVLGAVTFIGSIIFVLSNQPYEVQDVCENSNMICPTCEGKEGCRFKNIYKYCSLAQWSFVFDNNATVAYAVFISFWATLFMALWRRKENKLKFRWNCIEDVRETQIRQAYLDKATQHHLNRITGEIEPYTPRLQRFLHYTITFSACAILFAILLVLVLVNMVIKILLERWFDSTNTGYLHAHTSMITMALSSVITVIIINSFREFYRIASITLTKIENPRTQFDFDNSVLYKRYLLGFMNNYVPSFYEAFVKGSFARLPHKMTFLRKDLCQPCSCTVALCIQLAFLMTVRTFMGNICSAIYPPLKNVFRFLKELCCKNICKKQQIPVVMNRTLPQWEEEYYLEPLDAYSVTEEFSEMVIRFGYITFFSKAFPLAALCALLNNLIELRSDAFKFVQSHRRVVPVEKSGIGAWNGILRSLSYISTAINAFVIAFTSDWVEREVYRQNQNHGSLKGFVNSTLSKYATSDYSAYQSVKGRKEFCYFRGYYKPPETQPKYAITQMYWMNLMFKFVAVFVFEHVVLLCNTLFAYCLSYKPESVQLQLDLARHKEKELRLSECERKLEQKAKSDPKLSKSLRGLK